MLKPTAPFKLLSRAELFSLFAGEFDVSTSIFTDRPTTQLASSGGEGKQHYAAIINAQT